MRKLSLKELNRVGVAEYKQQKKTEVCVLLDNVRSALNVGSAFRTADAFAIERLVLCGITAQPPHREILKTAIGASQSVDWTYHRSTMEAIHQLKSEGYFILGAEQAEGSTPLQDLSIRKQTKYAIVFGNEVSGISDDVMPLLDGCIEIPQFGTKHSLNISVSVGIILWDVTKNLRYS